MAPRVAAYEHRLAAVVADPGQFDVGGKIIGALGMLGLSADALAKLPALDPADEQKIMSVLDTLPGLRWSVVQRNLWTAGVSDLSSWLAEIMKWKLDDVTAAQITSPMLVTAAQSDQASSNAKQLFDALTGPEDFLQFYDADGAGMHCEMQNRSMANRHILDWLDDTLAAAPST